MKSFSTAALLSLSAAGAMAAPSGWWHGKGGWWHGDQKCMSAAEAQQVADNYAALITDYSDALADATLAVDFVDYSGSVNSLINTCPQGSAAQPLPLTAPTFSSRDQFKLGQGQQPAINFQQLNLQYNCQSVTIRWLTTNTAPIPAPRPVTGIILLEVVPAPAGNQYPWIVQTVYSEFNSAAWLQNLEQAGICSVTAASAIPIILPSGTVPPPSGAAPASASGAAPISITPSYAPVVSVPAYPAPTPVDTCTNMVSTVAAATSAA